MGMRKSTKSTLGHGRLQSDVFLPHGGYRELKSFQMAQLVYDITERFCDRYIKRGSRTHDQMVQAARSGTQNIAEGSEAAATSRKSEIFLTNVARASLEELALDYQDFLRHAELEEWEPDHPALKRFKALRCSTLGEFRSWINEERRTWPERQEGRIPPSQQLAANGALSLLNLACYFLVRQLNSLGDAFLDEGGFKERLYRLRVERRNRGK